MARTSSRDRSRGHSGKSAGRSGERTDERPDGRQGGRQAAPRRAFESTRAPESTPERMAAWVIVALLVVTPFIVLTDIKEGFRLPQGLASGWLGLASLFAASFVLRDVASIPMGPAFWWRQPAIRALAPLAVVVAAGALTTSHSAHFRAAFIDFAIGIACVIGWSLALGAPALRRLLVWTIPPAVVVAALGVDQAFGWFGTLDWLNVQAPTARLRITSTIGNPGDVAGMLVLPSLMAVEEIAGATARRRMLLAGALIVMTAALIVTATLAAVVAIVVGLVVWTLPRLWPGDVASAVRASATGASASASTSATDADAAAARTGAAIDASVLRRRRMAVLLAGALVLALAIAGLAASTPLRARVSEKVMQLASGDLNAVLTGRLDGWRAAWAMMRAEPVTGVGQGAFRAEYADTRLALEAQGVTFLAEQQQVVMATPHNEALSVAAEQGVPGLVALAWAIWCAIASAARIRDRDHDHDRTLALTGLAALVVLSLVSFPLHVPAIAWPWLLFLAWIFRSAAASTGRADAEPAHRTETGAGTGGHA
jgi:O-antigen ligase